MSPIPFSIKQVKRLLVTVAGVAVLAVGVAMLVLPGPAIIVMPIGFAILATEFVWARKVLLILRERLPQLESNPVPQRFSWLHAVVEKLMRYTHEAQPEAAGSPRHDKERQ